MSIKSFFISVCDFLTYPFRKLWECFCKRKEDTPQPVVKIKPSITTHETVAGRRRRRNSYEVRREVHSAPVLASYYPQPSNTPFFMDDYFVKRGEVKNDKKYHQDLKKKERIKARADFMEKFNAKQSVEC